MNPSRGFAFLLVLGMVGCRSEPAPEPRPLPRPGLELPPLEAASSPVRLLAVGDQGTGGTDQSSVAAAMGARVTVDQIQAVVLLGDNFYPSGVSSVFDPQWETAFRAMYPPARFPLPFYAVAGNHDALGDLLSLYRYADPEGRWILDSPAERLRILAGGLVAAELFLVDSSLIVDGRPEGRQVVDWLAAAVQASDAPWKILALHHPWVSHGDHGVTASVVTALTGAGLAGRFALILAGHDHDLEVCDDGTTLHVVAGGGGAGLRTLAGGPGQLFGLSAFGFVSVSVSATELGVEVFGSIPGAAPLYQVTRTRP